MSDKIKVAIRVRPLIEREKLDGLPLRWLTKDNQIHQIDPITEKIKGDIYTFDHIFGASESNNKVFDTIIKPIIDASMQGFNGTVFAYGQTSSGKTYTMSGSQKILGIIPLAINYIFYSIENTPGREFLLRVSYMEIYNEKVNDLLDISKKNLKIQEDCNGQVIVADVEERVCKNSTEVLDEKMKGDKNRRIGETNMNERSSRSHTIFRIILESRNTDDEDGAVKVSHLNLVDLAGSERSGQSGATGDRFKEGCHINMSLTTLGIVINQLSDGQEGQFINFRDSKLTRLLQSSLGGNAMTVIVCAVTPAAEEQTQNTLSFASRAKKINNKPILNEVLSESALIKRYLKQIAKLNQELEVVKQRSGMSEVEAISNKLKEKEEINKVLNERISRLKEALIVSSSSPARKRQKRMPREKRRHSWCGQQGAGAGGRLSFSGRSNTLSTIAEQSPSPHVISPPQANSTRLDETMCPFEKFELELMRDRNRDWSDTRDSILDEPTMTGTSTAFAGTTDNCEKSVDITLVGNSRAMRQVESTPPFVLRQRINSMSTFVEDVVKEYDELREFTTLEKQCYSEENMDLLKELNDLKEENRNLARKVKELETVNSDLEVTLDHKSRKSIERETELENELKAAWHALESREKIMHKNLMEKECLQLKKITIDDTVDANCSSAQDEIDEAVVVSPNATDLDTTVEATKENNVDQSDATLNNTVDLNATVEATEKSNFVSCDATFNNTVDLDTTVEATERSNFISCDATVGNISIMSPTELTDPLKSFCLSESMIPVEIQAEEDTIYQINTSAVENKLLIEDLCEMLGEKDELKQKIVQMKSESANIQKEYEDKKSDLMKMAEEIASYEDFISSVKEALNLEGEHKSFVEIEKEINNLKQSKDNMEESFKSEIDKLQNELDRKSGFEQVVNELTELVNSDDVSALSKKISDLLQFRTSFVSKLTTVLAENEAEEIGEEELVHKIQDLHKAYEKLKEDWSTLNNEYKATQEELTLKIDGMTFNNERLEKQLNSVYELMDIGDSFENLISTIREKIEDADKLDEYSRQIIDLHDVLGEQYDRNNLTCENVKNAFNNQARILSELNDKLTTLESQHNVEVDHLKQELEEKSSLESVFNQLINSIQTCVSVPCSKDNVVECVENINIEISDLRSRLQEQTSKLTSNEESGASLQKEIDSLLEKCENLESFISNCHFALKGECNEVDQNKDVKLQTILDSIHKAKDLELQVEQLHEETSSLVKHKEVLEKMFEILSDNSDTVFSMENILDEMTKYKCEFVDMQYKIDKFEDCHKRILELENQLHENEMQNKGFAEVFGKIQSELLDSAERMTIESLPEIIIEMKNRANASSDLTKKIEEFVNTCFSALDESYELSENVVDGLTSIASKIQDLKLDIERANGENITLKMHKEVLEKLFEIFSEDNDNVLSVENVTEASIEYKNKFVEMESKLIDSLVRISAMEKQAMETESKIKCFVDVFEKIQAEFSEEDVGIESLPERITQIKNQALTLSDVSQKFSDFVSSCISELSIECDDSSVDLCDRLPPIISSIQKLNALNSQSEAMSEEQSNLIKHKEVLGELIAIWSEDADAVISVDNIVAEITKVKNELIKMHEKAERFDEYAACISDMAAIKSENNKFVKVFEQISCELEGNEGNYDIEMLPEIIKRMNEKLNRYYKFELEINIIVRNLSADNSNVMCTTDYLLSALRDSVEKMARLNGELVSLIEENCRLTELSSDFALKQKESLKIEGIINSLGTDFVCALQVEEVQSPELSQNIGKLVEFNRAYLELEQKLCKTVDDMKVFENTLRNIQCILEADDVNNIENAVKELKNEANKLAVYKNLINEISGHLSSEDEADISSDNLLPSIVNLKNQISIMTQKMESLEVRNMKVNETVEEFKNKMEYVGNMEQLISQVCSVLEVSSKDDIVLAIANLKGNVVLLKNNADKITVDRDSYLQTIRSLFRKFGGEVEADSVPCDEELKVGVLSKADSITNEMSRLNGLLNGIKQLFSDLSEVDLCKNDEIEVEDFKNAIEDIKKNLCEVYELKVENMSRKTEVENMKEKMQSHFDCVDIVFNLCNLLSGSVGKTVARCEILNIVDNLLHKSSIPLNESSLVDVEDSSMKVSEIDGLRKELDCLNAFINSLVEVFNAESPTSKDNLLLLVNNLKNDHETVVSKYSSLQSECDILKNSITEAIKSVCENITDDIGLEEKVQLLMQRFHSLRDVENKYGETLRHIQLLADFQKAVANELGLADTTPDSTVEALKMLKSELDRNQLNVDELKIQLEGISSEKVDLKEKVDYFISVIRENSTNAHDEQPISAFDFCKSELLKMIEDYNSYGSLYNDLCACLTDGVEGLSKETLCNAVAAIREENNSLNRDLQEMSVNNEKIISDLNSAYESVMRKLDLTKENENVVEKLKVLVSGVAGIGEVDLVQSVENLIDDKSKMDSRLQEMVSEISVIKSSLTENQDMHCEFDKCQSLLRSIKVELDLSDEDGHNELLDAIRDLKSKSDQAEEELSSIIDELRKCAEYLNHKLSKFAKNDLANLELLCSKSLLEQLKSDSTAFVNLLENLEIEIVKQNEAVKTLESANNERETLLQRINVELEIKNGSNELDSIKLLKDNLQQLSNENACVKATNEELGKTAESLKLQISESVKNEELLKSEKDCLNTQIQENLETIDKLKKESENLSKKLTDSLSSVTRKEETIQEMQIQIQEWQKNIEINERLVQSLKNELADQRNVIEDLRDKMKNVEESANSSGYQGEVKTKVEETLKELNKVQQKLDDFIAVDKALKKKLVTEIKNMKPNFKPGSSEETSVQLLDSFVAVVMEKYNEVYTNLNENFEKDAKKLKEKINQLESKEEKTKKWIEQLEADAESSNQEINAKSKEIDELLEIVKKKENELTNRSEDLENIKELLNTCELELNSLRAENKEMAHKLKDNIFDQNHSVADSLKLKENLEKAIEERDSLSVELNNKNMTISQLESTVNSQMEELKGYFNKFNEQQAQLGERDSIISNLKDKNEACLQEIEDLKQELKREKDECDRLSSSLNMMQAKYSSIQQSSETNTKATEAIEGKLEEFFRDMNETKAIVANLIESLKRDEQKERAERKALEKITEEKTNQCNDLKTKLHSLEVEISKYKSAQNDTETVSKLKEEVNTANKINQELRDEISENERTICAKQIECQRLESEVVGSREKLGEYSRTLSLLQSEVIRKDHELSKLELLKEEMTKLQECLKDRETKCNDFSSKNSLLEKELVDRSNQITKLQLTLESCEKELLGVRASLTEELDRIKIELNNKEDVCMTTSNTVALLEKQIAESEKIITKLKSDIICKDEDLSKMRKEVARLSASLEEATKSELKHLPKKLKLNRFENFSNEKENDNVCLKLSTSHNNQQPSVGCQKCKKLEKELSVLFKGPVEGDLVVEKTKQALVKLEELESKHKELQSEYKELDSECDSLNAQIKSLEAECTKLFYQRDELTQTCNKASDDYAKEQATSAALKKKNENLTKDLDACRVELERCLRGSRRERSFREADRRGQPLDLSASEGHAPSPATPNAGDFKSIKHRWEQLSTSSQKQTPAPSKECQCEELMKQNQELKLELADKNNKVTLLQIQIQGQNFPYKKKAAALEEALNEAKTKIMTLKQEVRRLQTCLHDVSVFQSCETCRNKTKTATSEIAVQTVVTDTEASVSGSEIIQRQTMNNLKEQSAKLERENMLLKRLCRDRNRKIEQLEQDLKAGQETIMTLKQEVRRLETCLQDVSVLQSCETCRNKKSTNSETAAQTALTDTEASVSGSETNQKQSLDNLKEKSVQLERENILLKRLCRDRNRKIEQLEHDLKAGGGQKP